MIDPFFGGIGEAPKFPNVSALELIWRGWKRLDQPPMRDAVTRTLDNIGQGGIYDHLGGGFARYSVDQRWLVPHFEKMLYDNAQLVELMTAVRQETRCSRCMPMRGEPPASLRSRKRRAGSSHGCSRKCARPTAAFIRASTPTASTRRASSTSGRSTRSTSSSAPARRSSSASTT
jgi:hypothetical protein